MSHEFETRIIILATIFGSFWGVWLMGDIVLRCMELAQKGRAISASNLCRHATRGICARVAGPNWPLLDSWKFANAPPSSEKPHPMEGSS